MSKREWKPGDVAVIDGEFYLRTGNGWLFASTSGAAWSHAEGSSAERVTSLARPLAVIDPEDREQVERLWSLIDATLDRISSTQWAVDTVQAALREFANPTPPKPDEPLGLGAVVEDAEGIKWCRDHDGFWRSENGSHLWSGLDAYMVRVVRVLSEGVTP